MTILDDIDATLDGRCAVCRNPLPAGSPSAWYCSENCQDTWYLDRAGNPPLLHDTTTPPPSALHLRLMAAFGSWYRSVEDATFALDSNRSMLFEHLADPEHPTAAGIPPGLRRPESAAHLYDVIAKTTATPSRLARAWRRIRTTIGGTR